MSFGFISITTYTSSVYTCSVYNWIVYKFRVTSVLNYPLFFPGHVLTSGIHTWCMGKHLGTHQIVLFFSMMLFLEEGNNHSLLEFPIKRLRIWEIKYLVTEWTSASASRSSSTKNWLLWWSDEERQGNVCRYFTYAMIKFILKVGNCNWHGRLQSSTRNELRVDLHIKTICCLHAICRTVSWEDFRWPDS